MGYWECFEVRRGVGMVGEGRGPPPRYAQLALGQDAFKPVKPTSAISRTFLSSKQNYAVAGGCRIGSLMSMCQFM